MELLELGSALTSDLIPVSRSRSGHICDLSVPTSIRAYLFDLYLDYTHNDACAPFDIAIDELSAYIAW